MALDPNTAPPRPTKPFHSIRTRLALTLSLVLGGVFTFSILIYSFGLPFTKFGGLRGQYYQQARGRLEQIADLGKADLQGWMRELRQDALMLTKYELMETAVPHLQADLERWEKQNPSEISTKLQSQSEYKKLVEFLNFVAATPPGYEAIQLLDLENQRVLAAVPVSEPRPPRADIPGLAKVLASSGGNAIIAATSSQTDKPVIYICQQFGKKGNATALLLTLNMQALLAPLSRAGRELGNTGEIVLLDETGNILLPLEPKRFRDKNLKLFDFRGGAPAKGAAVGRETFIEAPDYRGIPVMAAARYLPLTADYGWELVVKQDREEIFAPLKETLYYTLGAAIFFAGFLLILAFSLASRLTRPLRELSSTAEQVAQGDFEARAAITTADEVGLLAATINQMLTEIQHWHTRLEELVRHRTEQLEQANAELWQEIGQRKEAEASLARAAREWEGTFDSVLDLILIIDDQFRIVRANRALMQAVGRPEAELVGRHCYEIVHAANLPPEFCPTAELFADGQAHRTEIIEPKLGVALEISVTPLRAEDGKITGAVQLAHDITQRKQAEARIQAHVRFMEDLGKVEQVIRSAKDLAALLPDMLDAVRAIFDCDRAWLLYPCDPEAPAFQVRMIRTREQYAIAELAPHTEVLITPEVAEAFRLARDSDRPVTFDPQSGRDIPLGERFNIQSQMITAIRPRTGGAWLFGMHQCSEARAWTEAEQLLFAEIGSRLSDALSSLLFLADLRESEQRYRQLAENVTDVIWTTDLELRLTYISPSVARQRGYRPEELLGKPPEETMTPESAEIVRQALAEALTGASNGAGKFPKVVRYEVEAFKQDGAAFFAEVELTILDDDAHKPCGVLGVTRDITEHKKAEATRQAHTRFLQTLIDAIPAPVFYKDVEGRYLGCNKAFEEFYKTSRGRIIGKTVFDIASSEQAEIYYAEDAELLRRSGTQVYEASVMRDDGFRREVIFNKATFQNLDGSLGGIVGAMLDITERKEIELSLLSLNRALQVIRECNEILVRAEEENELLGKICESLVQSGGYRFVWIGAKEWDAARTVRPIAYCGVEENFLKQIFISWGDNPHGQCPTGRAIRTGKPQVCKDIAQDPGFLLWQQAALELNFASLLALPLNIAGETIGALNIYSAKKDAFDPQEIILLEELTNDLAYGINALRIKAEHRRAGEAIRQLNAELEQRVEERTAQLEALNRDLESFSYSVSHDLRAPLRSIDGFSLALLEEYQDKLGSQAKKDLERVRAAAQRMGKLIEDLLGLSQVSRRPLQWEKVNLSKLAEEIANELQQSRRDRKGTFDITKGLTAKGDPGLLRSALENLLGNAWKFTAKQAAAEISFGAEKQKGETVYFVKDNGAGFDPAYAHKLFGVFQRLHSTAEFPGTGIGLATVQRIIRRHNGRIWAEGELKKGATLYFTLGKEPG